MLIDWIKNHAKELTVLTGAAGAQYFASGELENGVMKVMLKAGPMFFGILLMFYIAMSAFFPTVSKHCDLNFKADWTSLPAVHRAWLTMAVLFLLMCLAVVCVFNAVSLQS